MTNERSCPCRPGVLTVTHTGTTPFPQKLKSARLLLSLSLVLGVMFFANVTSAFGQLHGAGIQKSCTGPVIVCDADADCSGASGECQKINATLRVNIQPAVVIAVTNLDVFGDTIRVNSAFDIIAAPLAPNVGVRRQVTLQIVAVSGIHDCVVGGSLPCDLLTTSSTVTFASSGYNPTAADPDPLPDQGNSQVQDLCNVQQPAAAPTTKNQYELRPHLVSGCSVAF